MKAIVTKRLNRRAGSPSVNAQKLTPLEPGTSIEIAETLKGDNVDGNDTWYRSTEGWYVWSGGVDSGELNTVLMDYKRLLSDINDVWVKNEGENSLIIIIDSGVFIDDINFTTESVTQIDLVQSSFIKEDYHGTFICGIIAAKNNLLRGISTGSNITSIRFKDSYTDLQTILTNLKSALEYIQKSGIINNKPAIINISQGFNQYQVNLHPAIIKDITKLIQELVNLNVLIVCAAGENNSLSESNSLFPASLNETVAIGSISENFSNNSFSESVDIITPYVPFKSFNNSFEIVNGSGSSFSTGLISGIISLLLSYKVSNGIKTLSKSDALSILGKYSTDISDFNFNEIKQAQFYVTKT